MKKRWMIVFLVFAALAVALSFASCDIGADGGGGTGVFTLSVGRAITGGDDDGMWDGVAIADLYHTIWFFDAAGAQKLRIDDKKNETITYSVAPGTYEVYVEAWTGPGRTGDFKAIGYALNVAIKSGANAATPLKMRLPFTFSSAPTITPTGVVATGTLLTASAAKHADDTRNVAFTWQWYKDNAAISGATGHTYTPTAAGAYTVTASGYTGSTSTSNMVTVKAPMTFNVATANEWTTAVNTIKDDGGDNVYTINITADIPALPGYATGNNTFGNVTGIDVTINGNNHIVTLSGQGSLLRIGADQSVIMNDLTLKGNSDNGSSLVFISGNNAAFTMNGGGVTGNVAPSCGGVHIYPGGTFTMSGAAKVSGNTAFADGGGIGINGGTFIMLGGEVSGNTLSSNTQSGGGVKMNSSATLRIVNGTIYGNNESDAALQNIAPVAAALYLSGTAQYGTFGTDGTWNSNGNLSTRDETIKVTNGVLTLVAPTAADFDVGNLSQVAGSVTAVTVTPKSGKSGGARTIYYAGSTTRPTAAGEYPVTFDVAASGYWAAATGLHAGTLVVHEQQFDVNSQATWDAAVNGMTAGNATTARYYLINVIGDFGIDGVTGDGITTFINDSYVTINGNNHTISLNGNGSLIRINYHQTVIINDLTLEGHSSNTSPLVIILYDGPSFTMNNSVLTGNTNSGGATGGGAVYLFGRATFTMNGGAVSGNTANTGGGLSITGGTFIMNGGTISGNTANNGGGVYITSSTFIMNGGVISGNTATNNTYGGGGVSNSSTFRIVNGTIYGSNEADQSLRNTANGSAALYTSNFGTAQYGTFGIPNDVSTWNSAGTLSTTNNTIRVVNGKLQ